MFEASFYLALILFIYGLAAQICRYKKESRQLNVEAERGYQAPGKQTRIQGVAGFLNMLFQVRLFKAGKVRWVSHFLLFVSFLYLLVVHGLYTLPADIFFDDYQATLNPFQAFRNITGFLVLAASVGFLVRRGLKLRVNIDRGSAGRNIKFNGFAAIGLIIAVIGSGFLLEASKIISEPVFMEMVEEYSMIDDEEELADLKLFWQENYSVVFTKTLQVSDSQLENGAVLNEDNCLYCHSPIQSAAVSNLTAKILGIAGNWLNVNRADKTLYWVHYLLCLALLIILPFSRLFHLILIPFSTGRSQLTVKDLETQPAFIHPGTLDACTNCGYCSEVCSVYPNYQVYQNPDILPHSKIESIKRLIQEPGRADIRQLNAGNTECTLCHKCTDICPSGIDLQSLWMVLDDKMSRQGIVSKTTFVNETSLTEWNSKESADPLQLPGIVQGQPGITSELADQTRSFESCIQCTVCTNVCPVVDYDAGVNDMSPHQIMNLLRLGKKHLATGTRMVWSCLTCYSCQENCPQGIRVTDILLELRNAGSVKALAMKNNTTATRQADK